MIVINSVAYTEQLISTGIIRGIATVNEMYLADQTIVISPENINTVYSDRTQQIEFTRVLFTEEDLEDEGGSYTKLHWQMESKNPYWSWYDPSKTKADYPEICSLLLFKSPDNNNNLAYISFTDQQYIGICKKYILDLTVIIRDEKVIATTLNVIDAVNAYSSLHSSSIKPSTYRGYSQEDLISLVNTRTIPLLGGLAQYLEGKTVMYDYLQDINIPPYPANFIPREYRIVVIGGRQILRVFGVYHNTNQVSMLSFPLNSLSWDPEVKQDYVIPGTITNIYPSFKNYVVTSGTNTYLFPTHKSANPINFESTPWIRDIGGFITPNSMDLTTREEDVITSHFSSPTAPGSRVIYVSNEFQIYSAQFRLFVSTNINYPGVQNSSPLPTKIPDITDNNPYIFQLSNDIMLIFDRNRSRCALIVNIVTTNQINQSRSITPTINTSPQDIIDYLFQFKVSNYYPGGDPMDILKNMIFGNGFIYLRINNQLKIW